MKSIFIVDDIKVNLKVLEVLLTRNGYNTISALSGKSALSQLQANSVDLIISDIQMPEMDGFQFCRLCKLDEDLKQIPFVFYSSMNTEAEARKLAKAVGAQGFIAKPADPGMLLETIDNILYEYDSAGLAGQQNKPFELNRPYNRQLVDKLETRKARHGYEQSHNQLLEKLPCAVWTVDSKGEIIYTNPAVEQITGFSANLIQKMGKRGCLERVHPSDAQKVRTAYKNLFQNNIALDVEYWFEKHNGDFVWLCEKSGMPYKKQGQLYADGISIDLSQKKYIQANDLKFRENQVVKTFARGAAHDMNNFLKGIEGYIELSMMESATASQRERYLSNALKTSRSASELTLNFFELAGSRKPEKQSTLFVDVISKAARSLLNESGIEYKIEIPQDLWSCMVDPKLMAQAVENVIINAMEAVFQDGFIEVALENLSIRANDFYANCSIKPGNYIRATVRDNGRGIDKEKLFQTFYPYYSTKSFDIQNGVGLSLALSDAVIIRHKGVMTVDSGRKQGTAVYIYLPALKPEEKSG